eukprot:TRINITY_DN2005_c1_g2_i5.p1 TRINITY_DN2005_c1_g2~~TRINITY_DN2005_c1_g2_i5.p1  ORF type:complete len:219 (+),score=-7.51 TRINITY_DN2005_c1_g2_i5:569-1225(+)
MLINCNCHYTKHIKPNTNQCWFKYLLISTSSPCLIYTRKKKHYFQYCIIINSFNQNKKNKLIFQLLKSLNGHKQLENKQKLKNNSLSKKRFSQFNYEPCLKVLLFSKITIIIHTLGRIGGQKKGFSDTPFFLRYPQIFLGDKQEVLQKKIIKILNIQNKFKLVRSVKMLGKLVSIFSPSHTPQKFRSIIRDFLAEIRSKSRQNTHKSRTKYTEIYGNF